MERATNAAVMRASNRKLILNIIRMGPISRAELSEQTQLTRASITQIIDELISAGLVVADSTEEGQTMGRKRTRLALCRRARYVFGVNISRHRCTVGVIDLYGEVLAESEFMLAGLSVDAAADKIAQLIAVQKLELGLEAGNILGIGVSAPGPVDHIRGVILNPPNFSSWHNVAICDLLEKRTGYHVGLEKDTNARTLEEKYFGAGKDISNFMLVQIDDGVGSGVMIHDRVYRGTHGMGTEIGHTSIRYDGPPCACGNRGCLENYLRIPALLEGTGFSSWLQLAAAAQQVDAAEILDRAAEYLTAALINVINLFDLEKVILTGDVARSPEPLLTRLNELVSSRVLSRTSVQTVPVIASLRQAPARTGAMAVLCEMFQDRI